MLILESLVLLSIVAGHFYSKHQIERRFNQRLAEQDARDEDNRTALYKQQKAVAKTVAQSDRAVRKLADEVRGTHQDARLTLERTNALARDIQGPK